MATRRDAVLAQEIIDGQEFMGQIVSVDIVRHGECPEGMSAFALYPET